MVSSYGLYIEYKETVDSYENQRFTAELYMEDDEMGTWDYLMMRILLWMLIVPGLFIMAFVNYRMKLARQEREDTMFYKIYKNLLSIDPNFDSNKN